MNAPHCWVCHFSDAVPEAVSDPVNSLGGKGAGLRRLVQAGFDVPPGFIISTEGCRQYYESGQHLTPSLWRRIVAAVERLERETGCDFGNCARPLLLAVRSGAPESMPGVLDSLLNCGLTQELAVSTSQQGDYSRFIEAFAASERGIRLVEVKSPESSERQVEVHELFLAQYERLAGEPFPQDRWDLLKRSICAVMNSWHGPRAVTYRRALGLSDTPGTAVIVQQMFPCDVSGVLFTREPGHSADRRMVVEAVRGLGEGLVSGRTTPQRFYISRNDLTRPATSSEPGCVVQPPSRGEAPQSGTCAHRASRPGSETLTDGGVDALLTSEQLQVLGELGIRLEAEFGAAVDVEWGIADNRLAVLQARPIDASPVSQILAETRAAEITRLRRCAAGRQTLWVRHNLAEGLPAPTPLTWDIVRCFMSGAGGYGKLYRDLGYAPAPVVCRQGFLELVGGRIYADTERLAQLFVAGLPLRYDRDSVRSDPGLIERAPTVFDPGLTSGWFFPQLPRIAWVLWRANRRIALATHDAARWFDEDVLPEFLTYLEQERLRGLADCDLEELVDLLRQRIHRVLHQFAAESLRPGLLGSLAFASLEKQLSELIGGTEAPALARRLITGLESDAEIDQEAWLASVAKGRASLDDFVARFGHRATGEMELATPRWREDRETLQQLVHWLRTTSPVDPEQLRAAARSTRESAVSELRLRLRDEGASSFLPRVERDLSLASRLIPYREIGKHYLMMGYELIRHVIEELARRARIDTDVYFLHFDELVHLPADRGELHQRAAHRRQRWAELQRIVVPDVVDPCQLDQLGQLAREDATGRRLEGVPLSSGTARGPALIVREPRAVQLPPPGYVLVCPAIDPGFTPLLLGASALLVELGGLLSHGAVVARQFGIPAVACPGIMQTLRPSATVVVNGDTGQVVWE